MVKSGVIVVNNILKRTLCTVLSCTLLISVLSVNAFALTDEEELAELQKKIDSFQTQIDGGTAAKTAELDKLDAIQKQIDIYDSQTKELDLQITENQKAIDNLKSDIEFLQREIDTANSNIDVQNENIQTTYQALAERMRATYIAGETSTLEVLLTSKDYESFLTRLELMYRIARHDNELVNNYKDAVKALNDTKSSIEKNRSEIEEKKADKEKGQADIIAKRNESNRLRAVSAEKREASDKIIQSADTSIGIWKEKLAAAEAEYDKKFESMGSSGSGELPTVPPATESPTEKPTEKPTKPDDGSETTSKPGGSGAGGENTTEKPTEPEGGTGGSGTGNYPVSNKGMIMPLQYDNVYISAGWFGYENHRGIDFCTRGATGNTYGKSIRAAAAGTVLSAEYHYSWGYNVYIDHGNGVKTRYAHCSKMLVSVGQKVGQGQIIAEVGNTGNVSPKPTASNPHAGAHLHFEVWINGTRVNPAPWLP